MITFQLWSTLLFIQVADAFGLIDVDPIKVSYPSLRILCLGLTTEVYYLLLYVSSSSYSSNFSFLSLVELCQAISGIHRGIQLRGVL